MPNKNLAVFADGKTSRGFEIVRFKDEYNHVCSLQESSRCVCEKEDGSVDDPLGWIWLGLDSAEPEIMKSDALRMGLPIPQGEVSGWMPYPIPEQVSLHTRMHLNEAQVRALVERLNLWLETGHITNQK